MVSKVFYAGAVGSNFHNEHLFFPQEFHDTAAGKIQGDFIRPIGTKDGKPAVIFPTLEMKVLSDDVKFTLVGKFQFGHPKMDLVRKFFENLKFIGGWKLGVLDDRHLLIRIQKKEDYARLFAQQSVLIVGTHMKLIKWTPDFDPSKEPSIIPMWFKLPGLPFHLYNSRTLYNISQALGAPLRVDAPTFDRISPDGVRVQVERDFTLPEVDRFWITDGAEGFWQEAVVENRPLFCQHCKMFGHIRDTCYRLHLPSRKRAAGPSAVVGNSQHRVDATLAQEIRVASDAEKSLNSADMAVGEKSQPVIQIATPETTVVTEQAGSATLLPVPQVVQGATSVVRSNRYIQIFSRKRRIPLPIVEPTGKNQQDSTEEEEVEEKAEEEDDGEDWQIYHSREKKKPGVTLLFDDTSVTQGNGVALKRLLHGSPRNRARVSHSIS